MKWVNEPTAARQSTVSASGLRGTVVQRGPDEWRGRAETLCGELEWKTFLSIGDAKTWVECHLSASETRLDGFIAARAKIEKAGGLWGDGNLLDSSMGETM